jgi:hypothetical protein
MCCTHYGDVDKVALQDLGVHHISLSPRRSRESTVTTWNTVTRGARGSGGAIGVDRPDRRSEGTRGTVTFGRHRYRHLPAPPVLAQVA